jgi:histidinol-phosphate aminotransferase
MFKYNIVPIETSYKIPYSPEYKYKLDIGENLFPVHPSINNVLQICYDNTNVNYYNNKDENFDRLICEIKRYNSIINDEETVIITNGSDNALRIICMLFCTPSSKILIPTPTYPNFEACLKTYRYKEIVNLDINYNLDNHTIYDVINEELKKQYDMCYLVNPNMPIGYTLSNEHIETFLTTYPNTVFIVDEAYLEYSEYKTNANLIMKYNNIIVVRTFSKFFGIPAVRIGYLMAPPKIIQLLDPYYNQKDVTKIAINCALSVFNYIDHYHNNMVEFNKVKVYIKDYFDNNIINSGNKQIFDYILRDGMYFTVMCNDPYELKDYFDKHGIIIRNKNADIKGAVRVTIPPMDICIEVMQLLYDYQHIMAL